MGYKNYTKLLETQLRIKKEGYWALMTKEGKKLQIEEKKISKYNGYPAKIQLMKKAIKYGQK